VVAFLAATPSGVVLCQAAAGLGQKEAVALGRSDSESAKVPVIRISVALIQVDVVVTDKKGRHVTDLGPDDFEIREDGKARTVANASYVRLDGAEPPAPTSPSAPASEGGTSHESVTPDPALQRTMLFVVDDRRLTLEGIVPLRAALHQVVDDLPATDRLAMISTAGGRRNVLPPSVDRAELRKAIRGLRYQPYGQQELEREWLERARLGTPLSRQSDFLAVDGLWQEPFVLDSLAAIETAVLYLRGQPGRKALVLASQGFSLPTQVGRFSSLRLEVDGFLGTSSTVEEAFQKLGDLATRSSVVIHALDPRGLVTTGIGAADRVEPPRAAAYNEALGRRRQDLRQDEWSLRRLPLETGGLAITSSNDMLGGLRRIVDDLGGYYLVGYEPGETTFGGPRDRPNFRKLAVKVKRAGLQARTRRGFYAVSDEAIAAAGTP
jgi:VWFA-related protein